MVKVKVERSHKEIVTIKIFDHAGYADAGQDLVCASPRNPHILVFWIEIIIHKWYPKTVLSDRKSVV